MNTANAELTPLKSANVSVNIKRTYLQNQTTGGGSGSRFRGRTPNNVHSRFMLTGNTTAIPWKEEARIAALNQSVVIPPTTANTATPTNSGLNRGTSDFFAGGSSGFGAAINHNTS